MRQDAIGSILKRAREFQELGADAAGERAAQSLQAVATAVAEKRDSPEHDPMWREVHDCVVDVGASFVLLLEQALDSPESDRMIAFDINRTAPQNLDAHAGGELWDVLTSYYLNAARGEDRYARQRAATAVAALAVDEIIAINDIDPRDVFDDYDE
jgi:hypothetical protein